MTTANKTNPDHFYNDLENGNWENKPSIVLNPLKRHKTQKTLNLLFVVSLLFLVLFAWTNDFSKHGLPQAQEKLSNDTIKPEMLKLADQGKASAILWVVANYPQTEQHRLNALLDQKNADALMLKGAMTYSTDKDLALKYIQASALEGNPSAVKFLSEPSEIGITKFFTQYVLKQNNLPS